VTTQQAFSIRFLSSTTGDAAPADVDGCVPADVVAEVRTAKGELYLLAASDSTGKFAFVRLLRQQAAMQWIGRLPPLDDFL